ncbi:sensor histidine kinase [Plantactinospora endophytica]|uniref:histidine kinase n=1 Tax=Plantactinospora endophytica TaxID=673535 RepID=A0ABQ4E9G8_9ACTN|nr:HAMP domain-containing sensor histidine kinase [Plantactinospora endophytica]GIG91377.1 two-component sensor histidine kinase [Plantactinospora endophytica]
MLGRPGWSRATRSIHTRILVSYIVLIVLSGGLCAVAIHEVLMIRLESRIAEAVQQEFLEIDRLVTDGRDPRTGAAFTSVAAVFDVYFRRNVPSQEEAILAFADGRLQHASMGRFPVDRVPDSAMQVFATSARTYTVTDGRPPLDRFDTSRGSAYYGILPLRVGASTGAFVVTILPVAQRREIADLQRYAVGAVLGVVVLASACAWLVTGRVLGPVRQLTETARLISKSDLTRRIPVARQDEAAEMARTFNAMLDRLEAVFRREREFLLDAGHELRGPITISLGNLGLLQQQLPDDDEARGTIAVVTDELERMARIVGDLHILADVPHPHFLQPERIDLELFVAELAVKLSALAPRQWLVDELGEGLLVADRHRLTEAVINLADNAVRHTADTDTVSIGAAVRGEDVHIWVRDTGCGIEYDDQPYIFDRFRRGARAHLRYPGTGLGLAIVRAVAQAHGGRVDLSSRPGVGSTFTLVIPRQGREGELGQDTDR